QTVRLGRGEMFGQMSMLLQKPRRAEARAIAPSTLLFLDELRFRKLLSRSPTIRAAVRDSALRRGISPDTILPGEAQAG
ncbi:cyclic nucleotide-binding domain-containing protein, partial [Rhodovulum sulfidophilum]|nr:cyclic nucleotide-binding domain-containing protein [Rhodovulum sulfidophilum]